MKRSTSVLLLVLVFGSSLPAIAAAAGADQVAQDQQAFAAHLNMVRWNPPGWGSQNGVDLDEFLPQPPLAINPNLTGSANFKADEMAGYGYGYHQNPTTGEWPNQLAISWGYDLHPDLGVTVNSIESYIIGTPEPLVPMVGSSLHQAHLLRWGHLEIGVGRSAAGHYWVVHTGYREGTGVFLTGSVFDDFNDNGIMDAGEGLPNLTVTAGSTSTLTNDGGGYSIELPRGKHFITVSGPGYRGTSSAHVRVADYNVSADFISGVQRPVIRDYQLCKGREPTILGTGGDDIIYGTDGPDVIHGLSGDDTIYGAKGNDVICGGGGHDILKGEAGHDILIGSWGNDTLYGFWGNDRLKGGSATDTLYGGAGTDVCLTGETLIGCEQL